MDFDGENMAFSHTALAGGKIQVPYLTLTIAVRVNPVQNCRKHRFGPDSKYCLPAVDAYVLLRVSWVIDDL